MLHTQTMAMKDGCNPNYADQSSSKEFTLSGIFDTEKKVSMELMKKRDSHPNEDIYEAIPDNSVAFRIQSAKFGSGCEKRENALDSGHSKRHYVIAVLMAVLAVFLLSCTLAISTLSYTKTNECLAASFLNSTLEEKISTLEERLLEEMLHLYPPSSCVNLPSNSPSGYYKLKSPSGLTVRVYCDMTRSCGNVTGGWMRVAYLDMTDSRQQCPRDLMQQNFTVIHSNDIIRACTKNIISYGCSLTKFISDGFVYSKVCGKIVGYQMGSTNAFANTVGRRNRSIPVDGVSLTHGEFRQYIWTFAAGLDEAGSANEKSVCPCGDNSEATHPPDYVNRDYFCDTGLSNFSEITNSERLQLSPNPLWDGAGCGPQNSCCSFNNPPWFYKQLPQPTTDNIEMRVCTDEDNANENVAIESVEIYIQ